MRAYLPKKVIFTEIFQGGGGGWGGPDTLAPAGSAHIQKVMI